MDRKRISEDQLNKVRDGLIKSLGDKIDYYSNSQIYDILSEQISIKGLGPISPSTIRKLLENRYGKGRPSEYTLNAFVKFLGYSDWFSFVKAEPYDMKKESHELGKQPPKFKTIEPIHSPDFFKLSQGFFSENQIDEFLSKQIVVIHGNTKSKGQSKVSQTDSFKNAKNGDIFYLCKGNDKMYLIGRFTENWKICEIDKWGAIGYIQRKFEILHLPVKKELTVTNSNKWWMPSNNSTFIIIPKNEYYIADKELVTPYFGLKIEEILNSSNKLKEKISDQKSRIYGDVVPTLDRNVKPILDIKILSSQFAKLISSLDSNTGQMLGVFGSWGRGKTYFVEQVCRELQIDFRTEKETKESDFYFVKFHAWKYQDTEAVWAYLYESIANKYFEHLNKVHWTHPSGFKYKISKFWYKNITIPFLKWRNEKLLLLRLSFAKYGYSSLLWFFFWIALGGVFTYLGTLAWYKQFQLEILDKLFYSFGIIGLLVLMIRVWSLGKKGNRVVKKYTQKTHFNKLLGIQAEIQKELILLLKVWMKSKTIKIENQDGEVAYQDVLAKNKRLLLFVDDIDRCHETKMIQVIDSLRVMLENEDIAKRVVVISAVDETILERAIQWKYKDIFRNSPNSDKEIKRAKKTDSSEILVKEYMDKLFIGGIKLAPLKINEKRKILENYVQSANIMEIPKNELGIKQKETLEILEKIKTENEIVEKSQKASKKLKPKISDEILKEDVKISKKENFKETPIFLITADELEQLKKHLDIVQLSTPRQMRIFLYRYLLAKSIAENYSSESLTIEWSEIVIKEIIEKTNNINYKIKAFSGENEVIGAENNSLNSFIPKLVEIVVPY
ncbi:MAG: hypothetical protein JXR05_17200 [Flavobacteriaceae bacterium]